MTTTTARKPAKATAAAAKAAAKPKASPRTASRAKPQAANSAFEMLPIAQVRPAAHNIRLDVGDVTELAESIKGQGIIQPLTVAPHPTLEGDYILIAGHRRLAAAKKAGLDVVPCVINRTLTSQAQQVQAMLVENLQRADITPVEEANAYQYLLDLPGYTVQSIAKDTGRSQKTVRERVKLTKLTDAAKASIDGGQVTLERAMVLADFAGDEEATQALEKVVASASPNSWEYEVKRQTKRREWVQRMPKVREDLEAAGIRILDRPEGPSHAWQYQLIYTPSELTYGQRAELGHYALIDTTSIDEYYSVDGVVWLKDRVQAEPIQKTPEEIAAEQLRADLNQGLQLMKEVRDEHLRATIKAATDNQGKAALVQLIMQRVPFIGLHAVARAAEITHAHGEDEDEGPALEEVAGLLAGLPLPRLALVLHFLMVQQEGELSRLPGWSGAHYMRSARVWIESLAPVYGYELSDVEKQAIEYHQPKPAPTAEAAE